MALERANKFVFPEFGDTLLHFMFLQRIANIYPAISNLIENLTERITQDLPAREQSTLAHYAKELNGRILFMAKSTSAAYRSITPTKLTLLSSAAYNR